MAVAGADRELPRDASERRLRVAIEALEAAFRQKHGIASSHGEFSVTLHWRFGEVDLVGIQDSTTYK